MEKKFVGVSFEAKYDGQVVGIVSFPDVVRDTELTMTIKYPMSDANCFGHKHRIHKSSIGLLMKEKRTTSIISYCYNHVSSQEELVALIEKAKEGVRTEIVYRSELVDKWAEGYSALDVEVVWP